HTVLATAPLADANSSDNGIGVGVIVNPPPKTDLAVAGVSAPAAATQGSTVAVTVSVQNVGGKNVTANFDLVLTDATAGTTIGTQTVSGGLVAGGSTSRTFNWNTTGAALGGHTLTGRQTFADDSAANDQRSTTVTVTPSPADIAVTSVTAPSQVTVGDTAPVVVTVQNVGGQDVTNNFNVVLTDGTAGNAVIGTQTIPGLAAGVSTTRTF